MQAVPITITYRPIDRMLPPSPLLPPVGMRWKVQPAPGGTFRAVVSGVLKPIKCKSFT